MLRWDPSTCRAELEAAARHHEQIIKQLGLEGAKVVNTPAVRRSNEEVLATAKTPLLDDEKITEYRSASL